MKLSVIIPTCRRSDDLIRCLQALRGQQRLPDEVLVALREDDSETLVALATWDPGPLPLQIVSVGLAGASEGRNRCVEVAKGDVLVFTDDDTAPHRDFLARIRSAFVVDPALGGVGGPDWIGGIELAEDDRAKEVGQVRWWGRQVGNHHCGVRHVQVVEWLKGANMSFRRAALQQVRFGQGLRGAAAQFGEDLALSLAVRRAGWKLLYDPTIAVDHFPGRLTPGADHRTLLDQQTLGDAAFNETVLILDHLSIAGRIAFLFWHLVVGTRLLPGPVMGLYLLATTGSLTGLRRVVPVLRGRLAGVATWLSPSRGAAAPDRVSPALERRQPVQTGTS